MILPRTNIAILPWAVLMLLACSAFGQTQTTWTNASGDETFTTPTNWSNGIPGDTDEAIFVMTTAFTVNVIEDAQIDIFTHLAGDLTLTGGHRLIVDKTPLLDAAPRIDDMEFQSLQNLEVSVSSGDVTSLEVLNNGRLIVADNIFLATAFNSEGNLHVNGPGTVVESQELRVGSAGDAFMRVENGATVISQAISRIGTGANSNGAVEVRGSNSSWQVNNSLLVGGGGEASLRIVSGASMSVDDQIIVANVADSIGDLTMFSSSLSASDIVLGRNGNATATLSFSNVTADNLVIGEEATGIGNLDVLEPSNGFFSSICVGDGGIGTLSMQAGTLNCDDDMILGKTAAGDGITIVSGDATNINVGGELFVGQNGIGSLLLENAGNVATSGGTFINSSSEILFQDSDVSNPSTNAGLLESTQAIVVDGRILFVSGVGRINGDVELQGNSQIQTNAQTTAIINGNLNSDGFRVFLSPTSELVVQGTWQGSSPFEGVGKTIFEGGVQPGNSTATVTFDGDVEFSMSSNLNIEIAGTAAGEYDRMDVGGDVSIADGAEVSVSCINGFQPQVGDEFEIITAAGIGTGMFANAEQGDLVASIGSVNLVIEYSINPNRITLVATESPILPGDINLDGSVDLLDVTPFVNLITAGGFQAEADINLDGVVDLLDVGPFVAILSGG